MDSAPDIWRRGQSLAGGAGRRAEMKFLQIPQFEDVTVALSQLENEECRLQIRLDPYSCAPPPSHCWGLS